MVPGLDVAQIDSHEWAISSRGFNELYERELLVLVDGRTVYSPMFSGVMWRLQNFVLDDIERIEVIRGPGATMWGANAVNGVISVTTKKASQSEGGLFVAKGGTYMPGEGSVRYGGRLSPTISFRLSTNQTNRSNSAASFGGHATDSWNTTTAGFRLDWDRSKTESVTLDAESFRGTMGPVANPSLTSLAPPTFADSRFNDTGGHVRLKWNRKTSNASDLTVQTYFDSWRQSDQPHGRIDTLDLDAQHTIHAGNHDVVWGFGARRVEDHFDNTFSPPHKITSVFSTFVQDEIALKPGRLFLTAGSKLEHNSYTGFEVEPTLRLLWQKTERQSLWAAVSRAVRTPNRADRGLRLPVVAIPLQDSLGVVVITGKETAPRNICSRMKLVTDIRQIAGSVWRARRFTTGTITCW